MLELQQVLNKYVEQGPVPTIDNDASIHSVTPHPYVSRSRPLRARLQSDQGSLERLHNSLGRGSSWNSAEHHHGGSTHNADCPCCIGSCPICFYQGPRSVGSFTDHVTRVRRPEEEHQLETVVRFYNVYLEQDYIPQAAQAVSELVTRIHSRH